MLDGSVRLFLVLQCFLKVIRVICIIGMKHMLNRTIHSSVIGFISFSQYSFSSRV